MITCRPGAVTWHSATKDSEAVRDHLHPIAALLAAAPTSPVLTARWARQSNALTGARLSQASCYHGHAKPESFAASRAWTHVATQARRKKTKVSLAARLRG